MTHPTQIRNWLTIGIEQPVGSMNEDFYYDKKNNQFFSIVLTDQFMLDENLNLANDVTTTYTKNQENSIIDRLRRIEHNDPTIRRTRLWSFEVKKMINRSNVRESYFQAVSNSSWANFGYLICAEIQGADKEVRMLAGLHGIGLIQVDIESPSDSTIIIPAREKENIDWNAANRLTEENTDFLEYVKLIRQFHQTGEHRPKDWDLPTEIL